MADDGGRSESDIEALRVSREESRAVLDHRLSLLNDLDDKAMRTVRTAVILLGILASAAGIAGPEALAQLSTLVSIFLIAGMAGLFGTIFAGLGTYTSSDMEFGIGDVHRSDVRDFRYSEREYLELILYGYDDWIAEMRRINASNAESVFWTQVLLMISLFCIATAGALLVLGV